MSPHQLKKKALLVSLLAAFGPAMAHGADPAAETESAAAIAPTVAAAAAAPALQQVVVNGTSTISAERREASTGITTITADQMQTFNISDTKEVTKFSAGVVQPQASFSPSSSNYYIRGIGEPDGQITPSSATFVDGVYQTRQLGGVQNLLDVDSVTVDRGPTGFAGGHRAEAGAVRLQTVVPTNKLRQSYELGYGSYNELRASAFVAGPLVQDTVFGSIALTHRERDGTDRSDVDGTRKNAIDTSAVRGKLRIVPNRDLEINFSAAFSRDDSDNRAYSDLSQANPQATNSPVYPTAHFTTRNATARVDYQLDDNLALHYLSSARETDQRGYYDSSGALSGQNASRTGYLATDFQHELKLTGSYGALDFSTGVYYLRETWRQQRRPFALAAINLANPALSTYRYYDVDNRQYTRDLGAFGELKYHFTPAVSGTVGVRYDHETYRNNPNIYGNSAAATLPAALANFYNGPFNALSFTNQSESTSRNLHPELGLSAALNREVNLYASYREGSRQGGYDFNTTNAVLATRPYAKEVLKTTEAGIKSSLFNNRLDVNAGVFYNDFTDIQFTTYDADGLQRRFNAGTAHSFGAELELRASPTPDLEVLFSGTWLRSQLDRFAGTPGTALVNGSVYHTTPYAGSELPASPRLQGTLGASYRLPVAGPGSWLVAASVNYQDAIYADALGNDLTRLPSQTYVDLTASWTSTDRRWTVTLAGKNLQDKRYRQRQGALYSAGQVYAQPTFYSDPATATLSLRYSY